MRLEKSSQIVPPILSGDPMDWEVLKREQESLQNNRHILASFQGVIYAGVSDTVGTLPLSGWAGTGAINSEGTVRTFTAPITIPSGLFNYNIMVHHKMENNGTQVQDVKIELVDPSTGNRQTLYHPFGSGAGASPQVNVGGGDSHTPFQGALSASFNVFPGDVMQAELVMTPNMTNPRLSGPGLLAWNGVLQVVLVGY